MGSERVSTVSCFFGGDMLEADPACFVPRTVCRSDRSISTFSSSDVRRSSRLMATQVSSGSLLPPFAHHQLHCAACLHHPRKSTGALALTLRLSMTSRTPLSAQVHPASAQVTHQLAAPPAACSFQAAASAAADARDVVEVLKERGLVDAITNEAALREAAGKGALKVYCGFDPTADSLHLVRCLHEGSRTPAARTASVGLYCRDTP